MSGPAPLSTLQQVLRVYTTQLPAGAKHPRSVLCVEQIAYRDKMSHSWPVIRPPNAQVLYFLLNMRRERTSCTGVGPVESCSAAGVSWADSWVLPLVAILPPAAFFKHCK